METEISISFLEGILKEQIDFLKISACCNVGDNYTSVMHSLQISFTKDPLTPIHLILKAYPTHPARQKFLEDTKLFYKELLVYNTLLPDLMTFVKEVNPSNKGQQKLALQFPPFVHGRVARISDDFPLSSMANYLLMVDIRKTWGYKMADRFEGLDVAHCRLVMKELAKLHAMSWCFKVKKLGEGQTMKTFYPFIKESVFCSTPSGLADTLLTQGFSLMGSILEEKLGADSEVTQGYLRLSENATQTLLLYINDEDDIPEKTVTSLLRVKPALGHDTFTSPWKVICHGDSWSNNMLFLYDENSQTESRRSVPLGVMLVDLQLVREACPTTDLAYFFYTSTTHELRQSHLHILLDTYAQHFLEYCQLLGGCPLPGFSSEELKRRFHRSKIYGLLLATMVLPVILRAKEDLEDLDKIETTGSGSEENLQQLLTVMTSKSGDKEHIATRIVSMVQELYDQGVI